MTVIGWPSYLLRGIPPQTRALLTAEARVRDVSLSDVIRQALCRRYGFECPPESTGYLPGRDSGNTVILLRLQPELYKEIKRETKNRYGAVRTLILQTLDQHLKGA